MRGDLSGASDRVSPSTLRARSLRRAQTSAEARLWSRLRNRALNGHKFVRQCPVGPYFADFACRLGRLVIEIDGATHGLPQEIARDERRTKVLIAAGYGILRFQNAEITENIEGVLETILAHLERRGTL